MTRAQTTSTTQQNTGGATPPNAAGKNAIINSAFDIWQRGTSFAIGSSAVTYTADRWFGYRGATGSTISRQTGTNNNTYEIRVQRDSGNTSTSIIYLAQAFENADAIQYQGKTVVLSFWARAGANYSPTSSLMTVVLNTGTGTADRNPFTATYTGSTSPISINVTLTTSWQRFSVSATLGSTVTQFTPYFQMTPTGTAGAADYFEISNVQLEAGSVATPFSRNAGTLQGELAACQRYYFRTESDGNYRVFGQGQVYNIGAFEFLVKFPVTMRKIPTALEQSGTANRYAAYSASGNIIAFSAVPTLGTLSTTELAWVAGTVASGLVAGNATLVFANNTGVAYLGWSAEL